MSTESPQEEPTPSSLPPAPGQSTPPAARPSLWGRFRDELSVGVGLSPQLVEARRALPRKQRTAARKAARRGQPVADAESARFAATIAAAYLQLTPSLSRRRSGWSAGLCALLLALNLVWERWLLAAGFAYLLAMTTMLFWKVPTWQRNLARVEELNPQFLKPGDVAALAQQRVPREKTKRAAWVVFAYLWVISAVAAIVASRVHSSRGHSGHIPIVVALVIGTAVSALLTWRYQRARETRDRRFFGPEPGEPVFVTAQQAATLPPFGAPAPRAPMFVTANAAPGMPGAITATGLPAPTAPPWPPTPATAAEHPKADRIWLAIAVAVGTFIAWGMTLSFTHVSACGRIVWYRGALKPHGGFKQAFCGVHHAPNSDNIAIFFLVYVLPLLAVTLATLDAARSGDGRKGSAMYSTAAFAPALVLLAYAIAGGPR